jgi:hypothetical protein
MLVVCGKQLILPLTVQDYLSLSARTGKLEAVKRFQNLAHDVAGFSNPPGIGGKGMRLLCREDASRFG